MLPALCMAPPLAQPWGMWPYGAAPGVPYGAGGAYSAIAAGNGNTASTSIDNTVTFSTLTTRFENTDPSITYTEGSASSGQIPDWWHGSRSRG